MLRCSLFLSCLLAACAGPARFPLRAAMWLDTDMHPVSVPCEERPSKDDPKHIACTPEPYVSPLAWDGADNMVFRPLTRVFALEAATEAVNVNALDEVPDSAWFDNRIGKRHPSREELLRGACTPEQMLAPSEAAPGSWVIDHGKDNGASLGFRVRAAVGGKYMFKNDAPNQPERATAASAIGAAIYYAAGFNTSCEQIVYFERSVLHLNPGLTVTDNAGITKPFDAKALDRVLAEANRRGELYRMQASAWLPGYLIGPFRYEHTRSDDPNDIIAHDDRRELRGARVLAAWVDHFDAREQNSMDSWIAGAGRAPDASPGFVRHYYLDTSDCFGSEWNWDEISRRLGHSYIFDWADFSLDFITLGLLQRPWEREHRVAGFEMFGYFNADNFDPARWKMEYPNAAFSRATERDNAWMARILSRFDRADIDALVTLGQFSDAAHARYLADVLEGRLQKILLRYFEKLSPLADLQLTAADELCGTDLARRRRVWPEPMFRYTAQVRGSAVAVQPREHGEFCIHLPHVMNENGALPDDAAERYIELSIDNDVAQNPLHVYLYDLGPTRGYRLAGLERPDDH